jgi:nucleoside-diphosphate kinase
LIERTLAIIKPDAVSRGLTGEILTRYQKEGFPVRAMKRMRLTKTQAEGFYDVHRRRPFFGSLTQFMASGPIVVLVLEGENVIKRYRELMGATDPRQAGPGTLRAEYGTDIENNVVHGSDSPESAAYEVSYFFPGFELIG